MVQRTFQNFDAGVKASVDKPEHLLLLTHGFNFRGNTKRDRARSYWKQFGSYLLDEPKLAATNIVFFDYPSNSSFMPRKTSLVGGTLGCAEIPQVVDLLKSTIRDSLNELPAPNYSVLGHSLGTHISLMAVSQPLRDSSQAPPQSINLLAAPNHPHWMARLHRTVTFGRNPHTKFLGSKDALEDNLDNCIAEIAAYRRAKRKRIPINHLHCLGDPFVRYDPTTKYDEAEICNREHTPFDAINTTTDRIYKLLVRWVQPR